MQTEKILTRKNYFIIFFITLILSILIITPLFNLELIPITLAIFCIPFIIAIFLKPNLALSFLFLFIFAGTLVSANIGFTFKASQFFAIIALLSFLILKKQDYNKFDFKTYIPFILFIIAILPSLTSASIPSITNESNTIIGIRILFNYILLQIICFTIAIGLNKKEFLKKALILCLVSYLGVLLFGFFQQIGFYLGFYKPSLYIGFHSVFVDFYGPFLRISPGTFANEFGEITQSVLIFLTTFLIFMKNNLNKKVKFILKISLVLSLIALVINFTRASWIVYLLYLISIFFMMKPSFKTNIKFSIFILIGFIGLYIINLKTKFILIVSILQRFNEFSNYAGSSIEVRLNAIQESLEFFNLNPIVGNGWGSNIIAHNVPLQLLSETGIIGFICFYFLIFYLIKKFLKLVKLTDDPFLKTIAISINFSFIGCLLFDLTNHGINHFILWLIIGIGLALEKIIKKNEFELNNL